MENLKIIEEQIKIKKNKFLKTLSIEFLILILCGIVYLSFQKPTRYIIFEYRLPVLILAIISGGVLAFNGALYQIVFRNPLADPYILGIASGASFGIVSYYFFFSSLFPPELSIVFAITGSFIVIFILFFINALKIVRTINLILIGLFINTFLFAVQYLLIIASGGKLQHIVLWLFGTIPPLKYKTVLHISILEIFLWLLLLIKNRKIEYMMISEEFALSHGVRPYFLMGEIIIFSGIMISIITIYTGVIGFIGLVVPHIIRKTGTWNTKEILILSTVGGSIFIILSLILSRILFYPVKVPVGLITAITGILLFGVLIIKKR